MKRNSLLFLALTALMVFSFGQVHGAMEITLDNMTGIYNGDSVKAFSEVKWTFRLTYTPGTGDTITGSTNGFEVYTTKNGAFTDNFSPITRDTIHEPNNWGWDDIYDLVIKINDFSIDGLGADTTGFGGSMGADGSGILDGRDQTFFWVATTPTTDGDTLCVDSAFYPPGSEWIWSTSGGTFYPAWDGPHCFHVYQVPNYPPEYDNCPPATDTLEFTHCATAEVILTATDPTFPPDPFDFALVPPSIGGIAQGPANTVTWSYSPTMQDVCNYYTICIEVDDHMGGGPTTCCFVVHFTNEAPTWTLCPLDTFKLVYPMEVCVGVAADDDCDPLTFGLVDVVPQPGPGAVFGLVQLSPNTAEVCFICDPADVGLFEFTIFVTDQVDTTFQVITCEQLALMQVVIEKTKNTIQGTHEYVDVSVVSGTEELGGFDFLIAYDASAMNFIMAIEGDLYGPHPPACEWEYFTYRYGAFGNCGNQCPSGMLRVVGIAETNNGSVHPACFKLDVPYVLFTLDFLVTDNHTFECSYAAVRFFWMDCGDNSISDRSGDLMWVSEDVFDYVGEEQLPGSELGPGGIYFFNITNTLAVFPTYYGMADDLCMDDPYKHPIRFINFYNGGIDIACAESLDARGDVNLNNIPNEIADAVLFSRYFIYGLGVFHNPDGQIAATDVNADGMVLTVGDLVYLIRIVIGDAQPYPKLAPVEANYVVDKGVVSVDAEMGAALVVIEGDVTPTLLADNMDIKYAYNAEENVTRVLVYSFEGNGFSGEFLNANGNVVSIELGSYEGAVVKATEIPANFALNQNYPNPFNPVTTISFNLPVASEYTLTVYNVTGQVVTQFAGEAEAGVVSIEWDASTNASGIYFYKLNAGDFSATKKMVLLK